MLSGVRGGYCGNDGRRALGRPEQARSPFDQVLVVAQRRALLLAHSDTRCAATDASRLGFLCERARGLLVGRAALLDAARGASRERGDEACEQPNDATRAGRGHAEL